MTLWPEPPVWSLPPTLAYEPPQWFTYGVLTGLLIGLVLGLLIAVDGPRWWAAYRRVGVSR